jgi:glycosyltransferase involved in cell wall biosynthesis
MMIVIPAYQPDEKLTGVVDILIAKTNFPIVIVDDGSRADCRPLFDTLSEKEQVTVLHHEVNRGKGAALKTAFQYVYDNFPEEEGVITVDADGQHLPADVLRVADAFRSHRNALVTGSRRFTGKVPFKSRAGNAITRFVFAISTGVKVYDTQTGLRAFSRDNIPRMLTLKGDRYEYEISQLLYCCREMIPIVEVPIETVYIEDNASSHFRALRDGWRIYKMILMFVSSSLLSFLLEYILFLFLIWLTKSWTQASSIFFSTAVSRVLSSIFNYLYNKRLVFEAANRTSFLRYTILALFIFGCHYGLLYLFTVLCGIPEWISYAIVQLIVYPMSFVLQRKYVFVKERE